jgi:hypothetical protein
MKRILAVLIASAVVPQSSLAQGQGRPSFEGKWVLDAAASRAAGGPPPFCSQQCEISQLGDVLTFKSDVRSASFKLDGVTVSETSSTGAWRATVTTTASWDGNAVVIRRTSKETSGKTPGASTVARVTMQDANLIISGSRTDIGGADVKFEYRYRPGR